MTVGRLLSVVALVAMAASAQQPLAGQGGPDIRQMSGTPLPVGDVPAGTITVRVVKGALTNVITDHPVQLIGVGEPITVKTNETGRAQFSGIAVGARVSAVTEVAGERLESQQFQVPANGGIRLLLVATDPELAKKAAEEQKAASVPAQPGSVILGDESRIVIEMGDDGLNVFNLLQIMNNAKTPVQTAPLVFDVPDDGQHASVLQGSSPQAVAAGKKITVSGPFAPGPTMVQFAYTIPFERADLTLQQKIPVPLTQVTVMAQKAGEMHLTSPQFAQHRDMQAEGGTYVLGHGPALKAGDTITLNFTGLPHERTWPRTLALVVTAIILVGGVWGSVRVQRSASSASSRAKQLRSRRDRLFAELTELEERHRARAVDADTYQARRRELITALEHIYAELDEEAAA